MALTAVLPGSAQAVDRDPEPVKRQLTVLTWNICGETLVLRGSTGYCPHRDDAAGKARKIAELVQKYQADVVMLQEVCGYEGDVNATPVPREPHSTVSPGPNSKSHMALLEPLLGAGWTVRHAAGNRPTDKESFCRNSTSPGYGEIGGSIGVLIAVKGGMHDVRRFETVTGGTTGRSLPAICARLVGWPDQLCTTHLIAGTEYGDVQQAQVAEIKNQLGASWRQGVVIGGDLNGNLADPDLAGVTRELDACETGKPTAQAWPATAAAPSTWSFDHVFAGGLSSGTRWSSCVVDHEAMDRSQNVAGTEPSGWSDHAPVIATLRQAPIPGDMTGDDRPDLVAVDSEGRLRLYPGRGTGELTTPHTLIGSGGWTGASVSHRGDWTGDGTEDLLARVNGELRVYPNQGDGTLGSPIRVASGLPVNARVAGVGDVNLDGVPDAVVSYEDKLYRYDGRRDTGPGLRAPVEIGSQGWADMDLSGAGDADRDGRPDLLARQRSGSSAGNVWLYRGLADGSFADPTRYGFGYTTGSRPLIAGAADADGDSIADMWAVTGDGTGRLLFYRGGTNGSGTPVDGASVEVGLSGWKSEIVSIG
ncbi:FG-GAP-like repeat-containing protein [Streptomyces venezuelae]|uniref:FG-GAP-like repeat-containing protein n=1 Tax=Streptomyces venezuelae TaxID=54571 RepID=UPI0037D2F9D3